MGWGRGGLGNLGFETPSHTHSSNINLWMVCYMYVFTHCKMVVYLTKRPEKITLLVCVHLTSSQDGFGQSLVNHLQG